MLDDGSNIFDSKALFLYEKNLFLPPNEICALKLPFHKIVLPLREKFFTEGTKAHLYNTYIKLYSAEQITHVPMLYQEFNQVDIFKQIYTSSKSRCHKSTTIMAIWPSLTGEILDRSYKLEDVRAGIIEYFFYIIQLFKVKRISLTFLPRLNGLMIMLEKIGLQIP